MYQETPIYFKSHRNDFLVFMNFLIFISYVIILNNLKHICEPFEEFHNFQHKLGLFWVLDHKYCYTCVCTHGFLLCIKIDFHSNLIYNGNSVCPSVWAVPGKFFQALPVILLLLLAAALPVILLLLLATALPVILLLLLLVAAADLSVNDFLNVFYGAIWSPLHETLALLLAAALPVILLLRFGVRCTRHWCRSIKSKNRDTKCS
jgi:hypothetical protein